MSDNYGYGIATQKAQLGIEQNYRPPTVRERLIERRDALQTQLSQVTEALEALDQHPEVEHVLTLLGRANF